MAIVTFASSILQHVPAPAGEFPGSTVRAVLEQTFALQPRLRSYVLDDQGALRHHLAVFVDGMQIDDPRTQSDPVGPKSRIHVVQALSGG